MCWRSSPDRERPKVRLKRSTAGVNNCAGLLWCSVTSPTTSPGVCSSPVASDRFYTLNYDEPIKTLVPDEATCLEVDQIIWDELTKGVFTDTSRARYIEIMNDLKARGADAVTLSCTEIGLLVPPESVPLPAIDSVDAHVVAIVEWMIAEDPELISG